MKIQQIIIGSELLNGKIQDKNGYFLARFCAKNSFDLTKVNIIADEEEIFHRTFKDAWEQSDMVIVTGGLGPTEDDLTKNMLGRFFGAKNEFNQSALEMVEKQYADKGREYPVDKLHYQFIPSGFKTLFNNKGFAPGLEYKKDGKCVIALPGVPYEYQSMLIAYPFVQNDLIVKNVIIKTSGIPEAKIFKSVDTTLWDKLAPYGSVSSLPHIMGVDIGVEIKAKTQAEIDKVEAEIINIIQSSPVSEYIWQIGNKSLEEYIIELASKKNLKIAFAESCTGGLCASRMTDVSGSSTVIWGGVVSYSNDVKINQLGVSEKTLIDHGAVSEQTAFEMAQGVRENLAVDIGISTTGIAGPGGGSETKPVGTIGIGISTKDETISAIYHFKGDREKLKRVFSEKALMLLLEKIKQLS